MVNSPPPNTAFRRFATFIYNRSWLSLGLLLLLPLGWLLIFYIGSLVSLIVQSFWSIDDFSGVVSPDFTLRAYQDLTQPANVDIIARTFGMALCVSITCAIFAFPLAYYMARYASPRTKGLLYLGVMLPLWSSYLVRVYAWKLILANEGVISWFFNLIGARGILDWILDSPIGGPSLSFSYLGMFLVFVYIWIPYMILPINAALERIPKSVIEASSDLGAKPGVTFRKVILPLAFPGVVAGSIFTFSLTLGDFIIPSVIGNSSRFIGSAVILYQGTAGDLPLAAAFTVVPMVIMGVYLLIARRLGAFDAL
jgi:putative spermidine/putrescine transport system permease protein